MMTSAFFSLILALLPFLFFVMVSLKRNVPYEIQGVSKTTCIILLIMMAILLGLTPFEPGTDKYYYMQEYLGETQERDNEIGWIYYNHILRVAFGVNFLFFFLATASIYAFSYYFLGKKLFQIDLMGYFVIMSVGSLGFANYGNNTIRAGFTIALIFYAVSIPLKRWKRMLLIVLALLIHKSMFVPVSFYYLASIIKNKRVAEAFWIFCLAISVINIDIESLFTYIAGWDERIEYFTSGAVDQTDEYNARFRLDFLIYSIVPIYIANIWMGRFKYKNEFYLRIYRTYLMINAIWLIIIRMPFCDRVAYLSWFMIPIIVLYPILTKEVRVKNAQRILSVVMGLFIGVNVLLSLR